MNLALSEIFVSEAKELRCKLNYKQSYFCSLMRVSRQMWSRIETRQRNLGTDEVKQMLEHITASEPMHAKDAFPMTIDLLNKSK